MSSNFQLELYETNLKNKVSKLEKVAKQLPYPNKALRWIMLGPTGSGKSVLIKNIIFNKSFGYRDFYDEIYLFIKSKDDVFEFKQLLQQQQMQDKCKIIQKFDNTEVLDLINDIEGDVEKTSKLNNILFVFDDMVLDGISHSNKKSVIDEVFMRGRHANISIIISTQRYKWLNQNMRVNNISNLSVFHGTKASELVAVADEHSGIFESDDIIKMFKEYLVKRYDYITIDYTADHPFKNKEFKNIMLNQNQN